MALIQEESLDNTWTPSLPPEVETTCVGGGLIDYALLRGDARHNITPLLMLDDAPITPPPIS